MSAWTHVNASIRIDSMEAIMSETYGTVKDNLINKLIGPMYCPYLDDYDMNNINWPITDDEDLSKLMPCGSEGGLEVSLYRNSNPHIMASHVLNIFGDLRDFDSFSEIERWFKELCENLENTEKSGALGIRQATCQVEVEGNRRIVVLVWDTHEHKVIPLWYQEKAVD